LYVENLKPCTEKIKNIEKLDKICESIRINTRWGKICHLLITANDFKRREKDFVNRKSGRQHILFRPDLFQIDSYASDENRADGHANQTIQFDITGLKELKSVIEKEYPSLSTDKEIYVDSDKEDYSIEELAKILSDNYTNAEEGMRVCVIHLFGIRFGKIIKKNNYSLSRIISLAGMNDSYSTELNKGLKLYESIDLNKYGLSFGKMRKKVLKTESSEPGPLYYEFCHEF
jgi:hypothetical protein